LLVFLLVFLLVLYEHRFAMLIKEGVEINSNVWTLSLYLWHTWLEYHTEYHLSIKTKEHFHNKEIRERFLLDMMIIGWIDFDQILQIDKYNRQG